MKIIVVAFLINSCCLFGQTKKDSLQIQFSEKSGTLKEAVGWGYRISSEEWIDYRNVICNRHDYKKKYKSLEGSDYMFSEYKQNFDSIVTKSLIIDSIPYYVLIVHKTTGQYKYPNMKIDWSPHKVTYGYIFSKEEFSKLDSIIEPIELTTKRRISMGSKNIKYNEKAFFNEIINELRIEKSGHAVNYIFPIMKSDKGNIRFFTPEPFSEKNKYDFDRKYFEASPENFGKLLIKE